MGNILAKLKDGLKRATASLALKPIATTADDAILNVDIINHPDDWYIPLWREIGFPMSTYARRRWQSVYKNRKTGQVVNAAFSPQEMDNIAKGRDPLGNYSLKAVPLLQHGSNGVAAWWKFNQAPQWLIDLKIINPVVADRNLMQYVLHPGLDYNSSSALLHHQKVLAAFEGTVISISYDKSSGHYIIIKHEFKGHVFHTLYMHLSKAIDVFEDQRISTGYSIGTVGNSGSASGLNSTHLHFEIRDEKLKYYYDPIQVIGAQRINKA